MLVQRRFKGGVKLREKNSDHFFQMEWERSVCVSCSFWVCVCVFKERIRSNVRVSVCAWRELKECVCVRKRKREMKNYICQGWKNKQEIERRQIQWSVMFVATTPIINILSFGRFLPATLKSVFVVGSGEPLGVYFVQIVDFIIQSSKERIY